MSGVCRSRLDENHEGAKVAWARAMNCGHDEPGWAVKSIISLNARNTRSQADKSYHLVVSFPEGERPTRGQMEDIEDTLCEAIGFGSHMRVSAVHQNADNWHLHIGIIPDLSADPSGNCPAPRSLQAAGGLRGA